MVSEKLLIGTLNLNRNEQTNNNISIDRIKQANLTMILTNDKKLMAQSFLTEYESKNNKIRTMTSLLNARDFHQPSTISVTSQ